MNFRYPHDPNHPVRKHWQPWWNIARRVFFFPFILVLVWVLILLAYLGWGRKHAMDLKDDLFT